MNDKSENRETWLQKAMDLLGPLFKQAGRQDIPAMRVSIGFPSVKALSTKSRRIGECWSSAAADDHRAHIFISPLLKDVAGPQGILATLVHEAIHGIVGTECGHKGPFKKLAKLVGLEGKMTATAAGPKLMAELAEIATKLGDYPGSGLNVLKAPRKKQSTRLIKLTCGECGYTARTTQKWLDKVGAPLCPCNRKPMEFEMPEDDTGEDEGGED